MGVEYRYLLIPRDNTHRPSAEAVTHLIEAWRSNGFAVRRGPPQHSAMKFDTDATYANARRTGASMRSAQGWRSFEDSDIDAIDSGELILQWPVTSTLDSALKNPLGLVDEVDGTYFDLELHFSDDFVTHSNEMIDPMDAHCDRCGEDLEYWPDPSPDIFYAGRIRRVCPKCSNPFLPQDRAAVIRDGMTGEESELKGAATYRFAIVVDCGKCWQTGDGAHEAPPLATNEFLTLSSKALGLPLYGVGYFY